MNPPVMPALRRAGLPLFLSALVLASCAWLPGRSGDSAPERETSLAGREVPRGGGGGGGGGGAGRGRRGLGRDLRRDVPDGLHTSSYANGNKAEEGRYENGYREGLWTSWNEDGTRRVEAEFRHGRLHGRYVAWYPKGGKRREAAYREGRLHGTLREWYTDGTPKEKTDYRNGARHGEEIRYLKSGEAWWEARWEDGVQVESAGSAPGKGAGRSPIAPES